MTDILEKISIARHKVCKDMPYLRSVAYKLVPILVEGVGTMAVTETFLLMIDPKFVDKTPDNELPGVILHEILHVLNRHSQRKDRLMKLKQLNPDEHHLAFNEAADKSINGVIRKTKFTLPVGALSATKCGQPEGQTAEWYFEDDLNKKKKEDNKNNKSSKNKTNGNGKEGKHGGCCDMPCNADKIKEQEEKHKDVSRSQREINRAVKNTMKEAKKHNDKKPGTVPFEIEDDTLDVEGGKIHWSEYVLDAVMKNVSARLGQDDVSYKRTNRRHLDNEDGIVFPGRVSYTVDVLVALDTSGSMTNETKEAVSEIGGILEDAAVAKVTYLAIDTKVHVCKELQHINDIQVKGRGGTDMRPLFSYVVDKNIDVAIMVIITDGYIPRLSISVPTYPVVWCITSGGDENFKPEFGEVVHVK